MQKLYKKLFLEGNRGAFILLDPDRIDTERIGDVLKRAEKNKAVKGIFVGTSLLMNPFFDNFIQKVKENTTLPVIIFPGSHYQVSKHADAILFLSVVSGRNPDVLIGEQVRMAPLIQHFGIEPIPTAYILIESGNVTSVEFISGTRPIPRDKTDIALAHALASWMLGFKLIYLEAGSGARLPVPEEIIREIKEKVPLPLVVGGGLNTKEKIDRAFKAGADFVVIGNAIEANINFLEEV